MGLAQLGRTLRVRGRKVWVITLSERGALGQKVAIDFLGGTRILEERRLWGEKLPEAEELELARGEAVLLLVPRNWVLIKELSFPPLDPGQLARVVPFELEEVLPTTDVYTGWQQVPRPEGVGVTAYAVAKHRLDPILELFQAKRLNLWGIAPLSWARAVALSCVVDCQGELLLLTSSQRPEFSLIEDGSLVYSYQGGEQIISELKTFIETQGKPTRLIVTGDYPGALIGQLRDEGFAPEEVSSLPCALSAVSSYIKGAFPDLSPPLEKEVRKSREEGIGNYFLIGLVTIMISIFLGWQWGYHRKLKQRHKAATEQIATLRAQQADRLPQISERSGWLSIWAKVSQAVPSGVWLSELRLEKGNQIGIVGFATSQTDVSIMMRNLTAGGLGPVILNYSRSKEIGNRQVTEFQFLCGSKP
jgi:hypothetical protein